MKEQGDGFLGMLAVEAQPRGDGMVARPMEQTERGAPQHAEDGAAVTGMDQTGIFTQCHVPRSMAPILGQPVPPFQLREAASRVLATLRIRS